jgi:hypothetical protein
MTCTVLHEVNLTGKWGNDRRDRGLHYVTISLCHGYWEQQQKEDKTTFNGHFEETRWSGCTDDVALLSHNHKQIQEKIPHIHIATATVWYSVNKGKTKFIKKYQHEPHLISIKMGRPRGNKVFRISRKHRWRDCAVRARIGRVRADYIVTSRIRKSRNILLSTMPHTL